MHAVTIVPTMCVYSQHAQYAASLNCLYYNTYTQACTHTRCHHCSYDVSRQRAAQFVRLQLTILYSYMRTRAHAASFLRCAQPACCSVRSLTMTYTIFALTQGSTGALARNDTVSTAHVLRRTDSFHISSLLLLFLVAHTNSLLFHHLFIYKIIIFHLF